MCRTARRRHFRQSLNASTRERGTARALSAPASLPRITARVPAVLARAREVAGGCARSCSPCSLTPVAAPTHCTPAPSRRGCSPPLCPLSVSVSRSPPRLSPPRSVVWFISTEASRGPAGSKVLPYPRRLPQPPDGRVPTCPLPCSCRMDPRSSSSTSAAAPATAAA